MDCLRLVPTECLSIDILVGHSGFVRKISFVGLWCGLDTGLDLPILEDARLI